MPTEHDDHALVTSLAPNINIRIGGSLDSWPIHLIGLPNL